MPSCPQPVKYNGFLLFHPIFAAGQDLWFLRLVIKKGYENMIQYTSGLWTSNRTLYCECSSWSGTDT